MHRH